MIRVAIAVFLGTVAGSAGIMVYNLSQMRIFGWLTMGVLLGIFSQALRFEIWRYLLWGTAGGCIIFLGWYMGKAIGYPIWLAWPFLGAILGLFNSGRGTMRLISGGVLGFLGGIFGMCILPLITLVLLPLLRLPPVFGYDIDGLGLVVIGIFISGTTELLKKNRSEQGDFFHKSRGTGK